MFFFDLDWEGILDFTVELSVAHMPGRVTREQTQLDTPESASFLALEELCMHVLKKQD